VKSINIRLGRGYKIPLSPQGKTDSEMNRFFYGFFLGFLALYRQKPQHFMKRLLKYGCFRVVLKIAQ
jgi:hypothetical protein